VGDDDLGVLAVARDLGDTLVPEHVARCGVAVENLRPRIVRSRPDVRLILLNDEAAGELKHRDLA